MIHCRSRFALRAGLALALISLSCAGVWAQQEQSLAAINYHLSMPRPASHLFEVRINVDVARDTPLGALDFQMPKWAPGRYAVFEIGRAHV